METIKITDKYTETEVIRRILHGETALYEILIRRSNPFLYKIGRSYNYTHEETEDLMQDTFVDAFINLPRFEGRSSFKTWIIRIMLNNCYRKSHESSYKNEKAGDIKENAVPEFTGQNFDVNRIIMNRELGSIIENALTEIPFDYRIVFSLREITGLNVSETAEALKISESNVRVRLNRAKAILRRKIEKSYTEAEIFEFNNIYCDKMVEKVLGKIREAGIQW